MKRFKIFGFLATLSLFLGYEAVADTVARENVPQQVGTAALPGEADAADFFLSAGVGIAQYRGNSGLGLNLGGVVPASNPDLLYGMDLALNNWTFENTPGAVTTTGATAIQLLPTVMYRFEIGGPLFPYIGMSMGPNIYVERFNVNNGGVITSDSNTAVYFEALARPGVLARLSSIASLQIEAKFGVLRSDFVFLPQINAFIAL